MLRTTAHKHGWIACIAAIGCSGVRHVPVPYLPVPLYGAPAEQAAASTAQLLADSSKGIRYYRKSQYLLIYADGKGGVSWQLMDLPDQTQKMSAEPFNVLASLDTTLSFDHGALTSAKDVGDSTAVALAAIKAVESVAPLLMAASKAGAKPPNKPGTRLLPPPFLYKVMVDQARVTFIGGQTDVAVEVPVK